MSINNIDKDTPIRQAIDQLVSNDRELEGQNVLQNTYDLKIEQIYSDININKKYNYINLGHTLSDYTNWSHLYADVGYSIWKYNISNYKHSSDNIILFDNKVVSNRGQATSETVTTFDKVFDYEDAATPVYNDVTTEAGTIGGTEFECLRNINDYLYIGATSQCCHTSLGYSNFYR